MKLTNGLKNSTLLLAAAIVLSVGTLDNTFADDLPNAPSSSSNSVDALTHSMGEKVCDSFHGVDCDVVRETNYSTSSEVSNHFYANVMMSWEHEFGTNDWQKKIFYNGAYRVVDKKTGRQYDLFRFDNEQAVPPNEPADVGTRTVNDSDYVNDVKVYQTQQKGSDGKYAADDDDLTKRSKFVGEVIDEKDYDRRLHYFLAIPIGWDRTYQKQLGKVIVTNENELSVGGLAYAGIFQDDGTSTGHYGANLVRTVDNISFSFGKNGNSFTATPMEVTNDCAAFAQGINCEWATTASFQYQNDKTGIGIGGELEHRSGLTAYGDQTQSENTLRVGVSVDPVKVASGLDHLVRRVLKKGDQQN